MMLEVPESPVAVEVEVTSDAVAVPGSSASQGNSSSSKKKSNNRSSSSAWVATHDEMLSSSVLWPYTLRGSAWVLSMCALVLVLLVVAAEVCDNVESCMANPWARWGAWSGTGYCEEAHPQRFMAEHANSVSNIGFFGVGFVVLLCGAADAVRERSSVPVLSRHAAALRRRNHLTVFPVFSALFGLSCLGVGFFSFAFHAHSSRFTQQLDVAGIYWVLAAPLWYMHLLFVDVDMSRVRLVVLRAALCVLTLTTDVLMTWYKWSISAMNAMIWMISLLIVLACLCMAMRKVPQRRRSSCST